MTHAPEIGASKMELIYVADFWSVK